MHDELLKASEVAKLIHISVRTVWKWTSVGILPRPFRLGHITRWRKRDIEKYLGGCRKPRSTG
jgi:predicted DNA-binding transcriptional regulator AlpA